MQALMPSIDGNPQILHTKWGKDQIDVVARCGDLVGWNPANTRFVWRFGFLPGSVLAEATGVSTDAFLFVLADVNGNSVGSLQSDADPVRHAYETYYGFAYNLPKAFRDVIDSKKGKRGKGRA
jgi:hypothetical protein